MHEVGFLFHSVKPILDSFPILFTLVGWSFLLMFSGVNISFVMTFTRDIIIRYLHFVIRDPYPLATCELDNFDSASSSWLLTLTILVGHRSSSASVESANPCDFAKTD
jgi:hypothetical protein